LRPDVSRGHGGGSTREGGLVKVEVGSRSGRGRGLGQPRGERAPAGRMGPRAEGKAVAVPIGAETLGNLKVARSAVAAFMIEELAARKFVGQKPLQG
jgi:hypothetical protein